MGTAFCSVGSGCVSYFILLAYGGSCVVVVVVGIGLGGIGFDWRKMAHVHFHIAQLHTGCHIVSRIEKHAESSETGDEESDGREEAEDALGAVEGGMHCLPWSLCKEKTGLEIGWGK